MDELQRLLAATPLFEGLTAGQAKVFADLATWRDVPRGALIFREKDPADTLYIVASGRVKIFRASPDGREVVLHIFGPGEPFGEVPLFQGGVFPANAEALEPARLFLLPREGLVRVLALDPGLALNMLAALSRRLRAFTDKVEALALLETPQRLAAYLLHESEIRDGANSFRLDVSKQLLASVLGTARETLSRCLSRLAEEGAVSLDGRNVSLENREFLEMLAKGVVRL